MTVLCEIQCRACPRIYFVNPEFLGPDHDLCSGCKAFKALMTELYRPLEIQQKKQTSSIMKGLMFGLLICGPFWALFVWLVWLR